MNKWKTQSRFAHAGGGYYRGSSRVAAPVCSHIAAGAGIKCLSVNYRTAPEHKFPIGVDDTFAAYSWLVSPDGGGIDPSRVVCGGDSAGGGLILALLLKLRDTDPSKLPCGGVPLSPWTDLTQSSNTFVTNADSGVSNWCPLPPPLLCARHGSAALAL
jgi:acetyl esterase/lipase